ncbi:MAG TPA: dephospho-CoA kinase [Candidatus Nanopelagicaceae bacterium]
MALVVGLTGGIGSGKSLVGEYFADLGAKVMDADELSRQVIERGTPGFDQVVATFGDAVLRDGEIDRRALAAKVFSDTAERAKLEAIIHPLVRAAFETAAKNLSGDDVLVYEIPLLAETGAAERFDFIITVESELPVRSDRLKQRGMLPSEIEARIRAQATPEERMSVAGYVIANNGTTDDLLREVEYVWEKILPSMQREKK